MTALPTLTRHCYVIGLDAHTDLFVSGASALSHEVDDYEETYKAAAEDLAEKLGIDIEVVLIHQGPESARCDDDAEARALWQRIHDLIDYSKERREYIYWDLQP